MVIAKKYREFKFSHIEYSLLSTAINILLYFMVVII